MLLAVLLAWHDYYSGDSSTTADTYRPPEGNEKSTDTSEIVHTELLFITIVHYATPRKKRPRRRRRSCAVRKECWSS